MASDLTRIDDVSYFEKMVLARALKFPEVRKDLGLETEHFSDDRHKALYEELKGNIGFTETDYLDKAIRESNTFGGFDFAEFIMNLPVPSKHGIKNDQMQVYEFYKKREINKVMNAYQETPGDDMAEEMTQSIERLNAFKIEEENRKLDVLSNIREKLYSTKSAPIYKTGFSKLDDIIDGFEPQQLNVIGARSSVGKTAFALQLGINLTADDTEVIFCSVETTEMNVTERILSNISKVDLRKIKNPAQLMSNDEIERVIEAMDIYYNMNLRVEEKAPLTPSMVRRMAKNIPADKHGFIIIDYLQLMNADVKTNSEYEMISNVSREVKLITQQFPNVTIIPLAQVNRGTEQRQDKRPMMSDIRNSGQIEMDSSQIIMLYRDDYYNKEDVTDPNSPVTLEAIVVKNKDGGLGTAELDFYKQIQKIY